MEATIRTLPHYFPELFVHRLIISAILLAVLCVVSVLLFCCKKIHIAQFIGLLILSAYTIALFYYTVFGRYSHEEYTQQIHIYVSYKYLFEHFGPQSLRQVVLNIVMLIPFGFLMPIVIKAKRKHLITLLSAFILILFIESLQLIMQCGTFEVDDVFNNFIGTVIGILLYILLNKLIQKRKIKGNHYE